MKVVALKHLKDSGFVGSQIVGLHLEPFLQLCDTLKLLLLLVDEGGELLLVFLSLVQIVLVV